MTTACQPGRRDVLPAAAVGLAVAALLAAAGHAPVVLDRHPKFGQ